MTELQALQNAANKMNLTICEWHNEDNRKTIKKYFAKINGKTISPILDYETLNHFILGYSKAQSETFNQIEYTVIFTYNSSKWGVLIDNAESPKDAIKKAMDKMDKDGRNYFNVECIVNL